MGKLLSRTGSGLVVLLVACMGTGHADAAAPPGKASRRDVVLHQWARANDGIRSVRYRFTLTEYDRVFERRNVVKGEVQRLWPDQLRVDLGTGRRHEIVLFTRDEIHFFHLSKTEFIFQKPEDCSFLGEKTPERSFWDLFRLGTFLPERLQQSVYWVYGGLPVRDLSRRFEVRLTKEDDWYVYLDIQGEQMRQAGMNRMRVVLERDRFRVRQLWYESSNGNQTTLDFEKPDTKAKITAESIREGLPDKWKRVRPFIPSEFPSKEP
jgi:hypothetical protein